MMFFILITESVMKKSLIALAFGTFSLGIAEFVMMGILSSVAEGPQISIIQTGHLISAYALGVCMGAPMLLMVRNYPETDSQECNQSPQSH